jgi:outer membrane receptor protein involved in Fe transport
VKQFVFAVLFIQFAITAQADLLTGDIRGTIQIENGDPIAGVTITVTSPALMGNKSELTDSNGSFRFLKLPPGTYDLTVNADGFMTRQISGIVVHLGQTTDLQKVQLVVTKLAETVTVEADPETIDITSTTVGKNIPDEDFNTLPVGRSYQTIATLTPGVTLDTAEYDPGRLRNTPSILGSSAPENAYYVDGMATTDSLWGLNGTQLTFNFIDEIQVLAAGYEAEYGRATGGIINVTTKSGGNEFHGSAYTYFNTYGMSSDGLCLGIRGSAQECTGKKYFDSGADVGGSIIKDKLWYFLAYNPAFEDSTSTDFFGQELLTSTRTDHYTAKVNWNISVDHHLNLSFFGDPSTFEGPSTFISSTNGSPESYMLRDLRGSNNLVFKYSGITHSSNLLFDLIVGYRNQRFSFDPLQGSTSDPHDYFYWSDPQAHGDPDPLHINGYEDGGLAYVLDYPSNRSSVDFKTTYVLPNHDLKAGIQFDRSYTDSFEKYSGSLRRRYYDDFYTLDQLSVGGQGTTVNTSFFVQDSWQVNPRLNIHAGVRFDTQDVKGDYGELKLGSLTDFTDGWSPRLGFAYDIKGNGDSRVFGSFGHFYESIPIYINTTIFGRALASFAYGAYGADNLPFTSDDPALEYGFSLDTSQAPIQIQPDLKGQYLREFVLGYETKLTPNYTVGINGIYRSVHRVIEDMYAGGVTYVLASPGKGVVSDFPEAKRIYRGLEFTFSGRVREKFNFYGSYVYSSLLGNYEGFFVTTFPQVAANMSVQFDFVETTVNGYGRLYDDRPHRAKAYGSYNFDFGLTVGSIFSLQSGRPTHALAPFPAYGDSFIFTQPRGSLGRTPTTWKWDLHLEQRIGKFEKVLPIILVDVFNVTNQNDIVDVDDNRFTQEFNEQGIQNPYWQTAKRYQSPRFVRLGFKASW